MKFPKGIKKEQKKYLKEVYETSLKKSKYYARARYYEEVFKIFEELSFLDIKKEWKKKKPVYIRESVDYKSYSLNDKKFIVSTDKKILEKFSNAERSGIIRDMNDEYEQEILFKIKSKYNISLHPDMYYVIK